MSGKTEICFYFRSLASHYFVAILNNTLHHHFGNKKPRHFRFTIISVYGRGDMFCKLHECKLTYVDTRAGIKDWYILPKSKRQSMYFLILKHRITFLGVLLDVNLTGRPHISCIENKISRNNGVLYKARLVLNVECTKQLYFSFIHSNLNYANIARASTNKRKLKMYIK